MLGGALTCRRSQWKAESLHHSSTRTQLESFCSTDHTGWEPLFCARSSSLAPPHSVPIAAEIHFCIQCPRILALRHLLRNSALRFLHAPLLLCHLGERNGRPSLDGPPQTAGRTRRSRNDWVKQFLKFLSPFLFSAECDIPGPVCLCVCRETWGSSVGECPILGWDPLFRLPDEQTERDLMGSWHMSWTYKWAIHTWTCPPHSPIHLKRDEEIGDTTIRTILAYVDF